MPRKRNTKSFTRGGTLGAARAVSGSKMKMKSMY